MFGKLARMVEPPSIAVDLGTANTRIYVSGMGQMIEQPSAIKLVQDNAGELADEYFRYVNSTLATEPLRGGVIVNLKNTVSLLKPLILRTKKFFKGPVTLACAPTDTTEAERTLLCNALVASGASRVSLIPEVWAAAAGAGIDVTLPAAQLLVDIGEGVTDLAVFRDGRIIFASAVRVACADLHKAIRSSIMARHKIKIYEHEVERLTSEVSAIIAAAPDRPGQLRIAGLDAVKRCELFTSIDPQAVVDATLPVLSKITGLIASSLGRLSKKHSCEILESGICLTGGGACIAGMDRLIAARTGIAVKIAPAPLHAVINGAILTLHSWNGKKGWWNNIDWPRLPS